VETLIERIEKKLGAADVKASLADYIRLVQLRRELEEEEPREIIARWVEPEEMEPETAESEKTESAKTEPKKTEPEKTEPKVETEKAKQEANENANPSEPI
jgi:hypothetical protein